MHYGTGVARHGAPMHPMGIIRVFKNTEMNIPDLRFPEGDGKNVDIARSRPPTTWVLVQSRRALATTEMSSHRLFPAIPNLVSLCSRQLALQAEDAH